MRVVSNTSPISNLAIIGRLSFLRQRYGRVTVPPEVARELRALSHVAARETTDAAFHEGWLVVESVPAPSALGELLHAKFSGQLPSVREEMRKLRSEARFFIRADIENFILSQAGE